MSQPDYYGGYNSTPSSQQSSFTPGPMPPGMPPMPPAPMSGMPAFPPGFPGMPPGMPPPPQMGGQSGAQQYNTPPPPNPSQNQQFTPQNQYGQQHSNQSYGQQNNYNSQNKTQSSYSGPAPPKNENRDVIENQIFITNLNTSKPPSQDDIKERFGSIGIVKMDKKTRTPRIKVWPEKGCASVTYEDPSAASAAISWFSGKEFAGSTITVELATKSEEWSGGRRGGGSGGRGGGRGGYGGGDRNRGGGGRDYDRGGRDFDRGGRDRGGRDRSRSPNRGGGQKEGDWTCDECNNSNFARRTECNRCKAPKPGGGGGGGYGGGGYGGDRRGGDRGGYDRRDRDRRDDYRRDDRRGDRRDDRRGDDRRSSFGGRGGGRGGGGNVRDGDWPCPKCGVNNFASRSECFKCHASK